MYGLIDLLAIAPTWLVLVAPGAQFFLTVRVLRVLRIFRVLKLSEYLSEAEAITSALKASRRKIAETLVVLIGALIYVIEGPKNGFTSIPVSMYWAIVTLTTEGYGDLSPQTPAGKFLASFVMILGYAIIAVPPGIVTSEMTLPPRRSLSHACPACGRERHDTDARYCKHCGSAL